MAVTILLTLRNTRWLYQTGSSGTLAKGPQRLMRIEGYNPGSATFVQVFDGAPEIGSEPAILIPAPAGRRFRARRFDSQGFLDSVQWGASSTALTYTADPGANVRVDVERRCHRGVDAVARVFRLELVVAEVHRDPQAARARVFGRRMEVDTYPRRMHAQRGDQAAVPARPTRQLRKVARATAATLAPERPSCDVPARAIGGELCSRDPRSFTPLVPPPGRPRGAIQG
jgi:hypothetical protein